MVPVGLGHGQMVTTANFEFLRAHDPTLVQLGGLAERYFRDDPSTALVKLRQFIELLSKLIAAHHAVYLGEREPFEATLSRLSYERVLSREVDRIFIGSGSSAMQQPMRSRGLMPMPSPA